MIVALHADKFSRGIHGAIAIDKTLIPAIFPSKSCFRKTFGLALQALGRTQPCGVRGEHRDGNYARQARQAATAKPARLVDVRDAQSIPNYSDIAFMWICLDTWTLLSGQIAGLLSLLQAQPRTVFLWVPRITGGVSMSNLVL